MRGTAGRTDTTTLERQTLGEARSLELTHVEFLESMDLVNRAIQGTNDLERMMSDVLDAVLDIFDCDRAVLAYPCDPETTWFRVPMRRLRPEHPCTLTVGATYPSDDDLRAVFRAVSAAPDPVPLGAGAPHPVPVLLRDDFGVQSALAMMVTPRVDRPYQFMLHQCSYPRSWTAEERRLFQEIGRRLGDALTTMLMLRDLRQSEARLEEAQRITHVSHFERDLDTGSYAVSAEAYRILGLEPANRSLTLGDVLRCVHPDDRDKVARVDDRLRDTGSYEIEARVILATGEVRVLHSRGEIVRDESGRPRRAVGVVQDVTERRRGEYLTAQVFDSSPDGIAIVGRDYRYQRVNPVYARAWRIPFERMVGMHVADAVGAEIYERAAKPNIDRCFEGEDVKQTSWFDTKFGRNYIALSYTPLRPNSDRVEAVLIVFSDLTEYMRAQEALQKAHTDLAHMARVTTLAEISSSIAHEVNQPLAAIVMGGNASRRWLAADPPNLGEAREAIQRIINDGNRASQVIARIRSLLRGGEPVKEPLTIEELIRETVALVRTELSQHDVAITTQLERTGTIAGDRVQLQQVLVNLILNGADAMRDVAGRARTLTISARPDEGNRVIVEVADTGTGLGPADIERIFDAFYSTKPNGIGMGLSISRSIVEAHGGRLWATPNAGPGATFHFTLDAAAR